MWGSKMRHTHNQRGQSLAEYIILMGVVLAVVIATGIITQVRGGFETYFSNASSAIATTTKVR